MGLQKQVRANSLQIAWGVFRGVGAVLVLWLFSPTIFVFALWQLISNAVYCFFARLSLWRVLSVRPVRSPSPGSSGGVPRHMALCSGNDRNGHCSTLLTQTDKLAVSKMLSLEMLGYYTVAVYTGSVPLMLAGPIASAVFPA